uniref:G-protein coupled receptors family 1 profile domain-containing protein n=1 Tax=Meloidogyne enterolobii TaxID=390850 RepID=A0A6V7UPZ0_MELEN|nr:unnamed protein product [Meloidogyne enterolobii]
MIFPIICLLLLLPAVLLNLIGIPGITGNLFLIYVTIKEKKLRGPTNYLLALTAFFEILHQSAHFLFLFLAVTGINLINYSTALIFQLHSIFGVAAVQILFVSTAADRLFSFLIPFKYVKLNIRPYLGFHLFLAISNGIWMSIKALNVAYKYPTIPVTGHISDLFVLDLDIIFAFFMYLSILNVIIYIFVWISVRYLNLGNTESIISPNNQSNLLKSLILIVSIVIGGYIINSICLKFIIPLFNLNDVQVKK